MKNFVQPGDSLNVTAPYTVTSGQGVLVGGLFGVAAFDAANGAAVELQVEGVFDLTKEPALAIAQGARVFWDISNRRVTTTSNGNFPIGAATVAAASSDTNVRTWIDGQAALTPGSIAARVVSLVPIAAARASHPERLMNSTASSGLVRHALPSSTAMSSSTPPSMPSSASTEMPFAWARSTTRRVMAMFSSKE